MQASRQSNGVAYAHAATGTLALEKLQAAGRYNRWLLERVSGAVGSRVLEVGSGTGTMTRLLLGRELLVGIDIVDDFVRALNGEFADRADTEFLCHDISASAGDLARYDFDSAVTFNVLEHIEDDLSALRNVHRVLRPGGTIGIVVPAHELLHGRFDDLLGHWRRYTKTSMRRTLEQAGFTVERLAYSNVVGAMGWLTQVKLLGRPQLAATGLFDSMVPVLSGVERVVAPPFGLSVVAVGRKAR